MKPLVVLSLLAVRLFAEPPQLPVYAGDTTHWGTQIQHTMGLLATSTPGNRKAVKSPLLPEGPFKDMGVTPDGKLNLDEISAPPANHKIGMTL